MVTNVSEEKKVDRRRFLKYAGAGVVVVAAAAGAGYYYTTQPAGPTATTTAASATTTTTSPTTTAIPTTPGRPIILAMSTEPMTLDPAVSYDPWSMSYAFQSYEGLVGYQGESIEIRPRLAASWTRNENATVWTLNLRKDVKFHDGTSFNSEAVKRTFERLLGVNKGPVWMFTGIDHIETPDDFTASFVLTAPDPMFLDKLASPYGPVIISPAAIDQAVKEDDPYGEKWFQEHMVGTGPYKFVEWVHGQQITVEKFDEYWRGWDGKHAEKGIIKFVQEPSTQRILLEKADVDIATNLLDETLETIGGQPGIVVFEKKETLNIAYIILNCQKGPTSNVKVRKAISYAFDYDGILRTAFLGHATRQQGPLPTLQWGHDNTLALYDRDLEKARQLLKQAGYGGGFKMTYAYWTQGGEWLRKIAETFQSNMKEIDIDVTLERMVLDPFLAMVSDPDPQKKSDAFSTDWFPDYAEPSNWLGSFFMCGSVFLSPAYCNKEVDDAITKGMSSLAREEAIEYYKTAQRIIVEEAPALFLGNRNFRVALRDNLKGFVWNPVLSNLYYLYDMYKE